MKHATMGYGPIEETSMAKAFSTIVALILYLSAAIALGAGDRTDKPGGPGLAAGKKAPDFRLKDQQGRERQLQEFLAEDEQLALVFYRSADW